MNSACVRQRAAPVWSRATLYKQLARVRRRNDVLKCRIQRLNKKLEKKEIVQARQSLRSQPVIREHSYIMRRI